MVRQLRSRWFAEYLSYFGKNPSRDGLVYFLLLLVTVSYSIVSLVEPLLAIPCHRPPESEPSYPNPGYRTACLDDR
jgi:hypothetical protein